MKWIGQHVYDQVSLFRDLVVIKHELHVIDPDNTSNIKLKSHEDTGDFFHIATTTHGATTLTTVDDDGVNANLIITADGTAELAANGNITLDGEVVEIESSLQIDNDSNSICLDVDSVNTTANIIDIDAQALTTGSAIFIDSNSLVTNGSIIKMDVDDAETATSVTYLNNVDYDKSGVTGSGAANYTYAYYVKMDDAATNHTSSFVNSHGYYASMSSASADGGIAQFGHSSNITGGDTSYYGYAGGGVFLGSVGYFSRSSGNDFVSVDPADYQDYFSIETTTHGATTLKTVDTSGAEADMTFNPDGDFLVNSDVVKFISDQAHDPMVQIRGEADDATGPRLRLMKTRGADGQDNDICGTIQFYSYDDGTPSTQSFAEIQGTIHDATSTEESGKLTLGVASHDGGVDDGLVLTGGSVDAEVDVTIANGAASVTTITGTLTMGSTATLNNTGEIQVASQPSITTLAGLTSLGTAGATTDIAAGDLTMYNAVNNGNPTISLGSSATNRFEIKSLYNSGAQTLDQVYFTSYTTSSTAHDGRYLFYVDEVELVKIADNGLFVTGGERLQVQADDATLVALDFTASSATQGGKLRLMSGDGAAMADNHRLGIIQFEGAEDASGTYTVGAQIEAFAEAAWSASENGGRMVFSTTDGNASISTVLTLDSNKLATFTGPIACTTRTLAVTSSTDGDANGDVVYFGGTTSMTIGKIYHYKSDGTWEIANADAVATSDGLLGVALGAASDTNGMLLRGMVTLDHDPGAIGDVLYVQSDNAGTPGNATATAPSASGDCVRIIGYQVSHASNGNIWFNPDNTFVEVA